MTETDGASLLLDTRSRVDQVSNGIAALIRSRELTPGAQLPTERQMAQLFGVGRSTVREAVISLVATGVIEVRPGRGLFVGQRPVAGAPRVDVNALRLHTGVSWQLVELRSIIESAACRLAARRRTAEDIRRLQAAIEELRTAFAAGDLEAVILADSAFHLAVAKAGRNEPLVQTLSAIAPSFAQQRREMYQDQMARGVFTPTSVISTHEALLKPIVDGDVKGAEEALQEHLVLSWERVTLWPLDDNGA